MEHEQIVELVSASIDGEVSDAEQQVVDAHLPTCSSCREFAQDADRLRRRCLVQPAAATDTADTSRILAAARSDGARNGGRLARRAGVVASLGAAAAVAAIVAIGATSGSASGPSTQEHAHGVTVVHADDHAFADDQVEIPVGATVEYANVGSTRHLLVQDTGATTVRAPLEPGANQDVTFNETGTYDVRCEIHPDMAATVTVDL
jgi:plastocyanin